VTAAMKVQDRVAVISMFIVSLVCIFFGTKGIVSGEVIRLHRGSASIVSFDLEPITFCMNVGALFFMASILASGCIKVFFKGENSKQSGD
jgi:hypothetical protein